LKVFLDTNVIVAATATRGLCADVMREVLARHDLVISGALIDEVAAVLAEKIGIPSDLVSGLITLLRDGAELSEPSDVLEIPVRDRSDRILLSAALNGKAEIFVTGDGELLELHEIGTMAIVSPRAFWELAKAGAGSPKPR
jgi:putative PIN family toxin of toxin-antitoxin system